MATGSDSTRKKFLIGVLVVLMLYTGWVYRGALIPAWGGEDLDSGIAGIDPSLQALQELPVIPVNRPTTNSYRPGRNLFAFGEDPRLAAERRKQERDLERKRIEAQAKADERKQQQQQRQAAVKRPPPKPRAPEVRFSYMGYIGELGSELDYMAVLQQGRSSKKEDLRVVRIGEVIDEQFVVKSIDIDSVEIGYTDPRFKDQTKKLELVQQQQGRSPARSRRRR